MVKSKGNNTDKIVPKQCGRYRGLKPWKPGQSGNPNGRPKGTFSITEIIKRKLQEVPPKQKITYAEIMVNQILKLAIIEGDTAMLKQIWAYMDGQPPQPITHAGQIDASIVMRIPEKSQIDGIFTTLQKAGIFERRLKNGSGTDN